MELDAIDATPSPRDALKINSRADSYLAVVLGAPELLLHLVAEPHGVARGLGLLAEPLGLLAEPFGFYGHLVALALRLACVEINQ